MTSLTEPELATVRGLVMLPGSSMPEIADCLGVHPNTLKFRMLGIRRKWKLGHCRGHLAAVIRAEAAQRGYGPNPDARLVIGEFVSQLLGSLPAGGLTPLSVGLRWWLEGEAARFLRDRGAADMTMKETAA